jgi:hypothetical protein
VAGKVFTFLGNTELQERYMSSLVEEYEKICEHEFEYNPQRKNSNHFL